jgi:hypothetical protein
MTTETNELHTAIYTTQTLLKQAADVIEHNMKSLAEAHTRNGIIDDTEVQASIESDADLIAELRAAALPWDQRHKSTERPPRRAHKFTPEQVAAVRADLQGALQAHGIDTQSSDITQTFEGLPMRKLKVLLTAGWTINGVSIERTEEDGTTRRGAVTTGGMVLWWNPPAGQAVPETNFGDMAAPVPDPSPTSGMTIAQRILHVGGRNNAAGYVEFGSIQAVEALVRHVLRDLPAAPVQPEHISPKQLLALAKEANLGLDKVIKVFQMAQPAPTVQEPVVFYRCNGCGHAYEQMHPTSCDCMEAGGFERVEYYTTPPAAPVQDYKNRAAAIPARGNA